MMKPHAWEKFHDYCGKKDIKKQFIYLKSTGKPLERQRLKWLEKKLIRKLCFCLMCVNRF